MNKIKRVLDTVSYIAKLAAAFFLAVMLVVSLIEIVRRYFLGQSFPWADELVRYCIVGVAMIGGAAAFREVGGLVAFDLISSRTKGVPGLVIALAINTVCLLFSGYMFCNAVQTLQTPSIVRQVSVGLKISMFWPYLPIAIGLGMIVVFSAEKYFTLAEDWKAGKFRRNPPAAKEGGEDA
jgi:C4-dicarboxylate transporter DctQ subunit